MSFKLFSIFALIFFLITSNLFGLTSSNLPILVIETNSKKINANARIQVKMGIIYKGNGKVNSINDSINHFNGKIAIRIRGNSTAGFPKKPYDFTIVDDAGEEVNFPLLGMSEHEDWILLASYLDHTFIRTPLASYMSKITGRWASDSRMVELVVDSQYQGIYILIEKIARSKRRLGIEKLEIEQIKSPEITGGYIFEVSGNKNNLGQTRYLQYPDYDNAAPEQIDYIRNYDDQFRNAMKLENYCEEYPKWIDTDSFVDELIVQEAMRNSDAYGWSSYFHKHRNGKLCAGPVWDFDQSAGNSSYPDNGVAEGWLFSHPQTSNTPFFWPLLMKDPVFQYKVKKRWQSLRLNQFKTENLFAFIDSVSVLLSEAQTREFVKWPVLGANIWRETIGYQQRNSYKAEVDYLKHFLANRWEWMDYEIAKIADVPDGINEHTPLKAFVYPNPAKSTVNFEIPFNGLSTAATILIYSATGNVVRKLSFSRSDHEVNPISFNLSGLSKGLYQYVIKTDNQGSFSGKFIKEE